MRRILNLAVLALALSLPAHARGESSPVDDLGASYISGFFRATVDTATAADSEKDALAKVTPLLEQHIALDETARFTLGRYWPAKDPAAAQKFQTAFRSFVCEAFTRGVRGHPNLVLTVSHGRQRVDGTLLVPSQLKLPTGVSVPLDWQLEKAPGDGSLRIIDVSVVGIDARLMLRNIATTTLADGGGNLDTLIGLFRRSIAPAVTPQPDGPQPDTSTTATEP